jgi:hypothetical protein
VAGTNSPLTIYHFAPAYLRKPSYRVVVAFKQTTSQGANMLIDSEEPIPIKDSPKYIPGRPNLATIYRWFQRGVRGVKLQTIVCGGRRFVTRSALDQFMADTTAAASGQESPVRSPAARERAVQRAERELKAAGI